MQSRFLAVVALLFSALTLMASRAEADVYWSSIATACTPASVAIQDDRYAVSPDSTVAPKPGELDPIVLICNVPQRPGVLLPHILSMTYLDSTGAAATAKVQAQLIRVQRSNGARAVVATVTSNSFPQTTTALHESGLFSHVMNFTTNFYYVRIEIDRAVANQNVRSIGVALETTCGDGTVSAHEACDDGAKVNGDGCSATCTVESGYECTGSPSVCSLLCGNAVKDAGESCDGADLGGEDCLSVPGGFTGGTLACTASCTFDTSACVSAVCGDGAINGSDTCDDGNAVSGDGCSSTCAVEAGYQCTGEPSICTLICSAGTFTGGTCTVNETNDPLEMDYCILQSPPTLTAPADTPTASIFARVFEASFTEAAGSNPAISAQIGFGPLAADPSVNPSSYTWSNATFNVQLGNDDEYQGQFIAPAAGSYSYAARFTRDNLHWTYCDLDGAGSNAGLAFSAAQLGVMTVTP